MNASNFISKSPSLSQKYIKVKNINRSVDLNSVH